MSQAWLEQWRDEDADGMMKGNGDGVRAMFEASTDLNAEKVGRSLQLADALGLPENVVLEQPEWAERENLTREVELHPLLAKWAEEDRQNAALTRDDAQGLIAVADALDFEAREQRGLELTRAARSGDDEARAELLRRQGASEEEIRFGAVKQTPNPSPLEQIFILGREGLDQVGKSLAGAAIMAAENMRGQTLTLPDRAAAGWPEREQARDARLRGLAGHMRESVEERERELPALLRSESAVGEYAQNVMRMLPQVLAQIGVTYATGGAGGMAFMGGQIAGSQYLDLTDKGVEPGRAMFAALTNAGLQAPLEQIGLGKFMGIFKASGLGKVLLRTGEAVGTEMFTEYLQEYPDAATSIWAEAEKEGRSPEESVRYFLDRLGEIHERGLYSALVAAPFGLLGGAGRVVADATTAREAQNFVAHQKELHAKVEACRTKSLAPGRMEGFLQTVGLTGDVTLPADAVLELQQSGVDILTPLGWREQDVADAAANGQEIDIPLARLHSRLDEASFHAVADIMRPAPDAMNMKDVAALNENLSADMDGFVELAENDAFERSAIEGELDRLRVEMTEAVKSVPHLMGQIVSTADADTSVGQVVDAQLGLIVQRARALSRMGIPMSDTLARVSFQGLVKDENGRMVTPEEAETTALRQAREEADAPFWDVVWGRLDAGSLRADFPDARRELARRHGRGLFAKTGESLAVDELADELKTRGMLAPDADSSTLVERLKEMPRPRRTRRSAQAQGVFQLGNPLAARFAVMPMMEADSSAWFGPGKEIEIPAEAETQEQRKALRDALKTWAKKQFSKGTTVSNADTGWHVQVTPKGVEDSLSHGFDEVLARSVPFIPQIIEGGIHIGSLRKTPQLMSHIFANKIRLDGKTYVVGFVLREDVNGNRFYDHELTEIINPDWLAPGHPSTEGPSGEGSSGHRTNRGDVLNILRDKLGVNDGTGQILFQSAYHGTPHRFDEFSLDHIGKVEGAQGVFQVGNPLAARFADMPMMEADSSAWFGPGKEIDADGRNLRKALQEWAKKKFPQGMTVRNVDQGWDVEISPRGITKTLSHGYDETLARSVPFIPQIIESGLYLGEGKKTDRLSTHIFANKLTLDGKDYVVGFVVREDQNGNRFYDHELTEIIDPDSLNAARGSNGNKGHATRANRGDVMNILRDKMGVNDGTGRILFQSAYHGTPHRFDEFSLDHIGKVEGAQGVFQLGNPLAARFAVMPMMEADSSAWFGPGKEIDADGRNLRKALQEWAKKKFPRGMTVRNVDQGWDVQVTPRGIRNTLAHGGDNILARSVPFIPQIIENGIHVVSTQKTSRLTSHIFVNKIRLDGKDYVVGFIVREDQNGNRFYDHELTEIINPGTLNTARAFESKGHVARANRGDVINILRDKLGVNDGTGRILFQSAYHGTPEGAVVARGDELGVPEGAGIKEYQKAAREVYRELQKTPAHREDLGEIKFTGAGFGKMLVSGADPRKWKLVPKLKDIVEQGEYIGRHLLEKDRKDDIVAFHWVESDVVLEGENLRVGIQIAEDKQGNKFYNLNQDLEGWRQKYEAPNRTDIRFGGRELLQDASASVTSNIGMDSDGVNLHILSQGGRNAALGSTTPDASGNYVVQLFRGANLSTLTHETAHVFFLDMERLEREGLADERMLADLAALREWTAALDDDAALKTEYDRYMKDSAYRGMAFEDLADRRKEDARNRAKQEMLARGFEQYLREGKAPSRKLEGVFARFRKWLTRVYRDALALNVELSDEVRDVFDRMLAHEEEMDLKAEAAHIRDETARLLDALELKGAKRLEMEGLIADAKREAAEKLRHVRDANRLKQRRAWAKEAQEQMAREQVYVARRALRQTPLDLGSFNDVNGEALGKALVKKLPGSARWEGGVEPEVFAAEQGYESAAALARDIIDSPTPGQRVKQLVDQRQAEHDALFDADDYLFEQEQLAKQQEKIAAALEAKIQSLTAEQRYRLEVAGKTVGGEEVRPTAEEYEDFGRMARWRVQRDQLRAQAQAVLDRKPMGEAVLPEPFRRAAGRWMQEERRAILKGDFGKGLEANYKARINIEMARQAAERRDLVQKLEKRTKKFLGMDKADSDARFTVFVLAQNIGLFSPTRTMLANAGDKGLDNVNVFFARMREEGFIGAEDAFAEKLFTTRGAWKGMAWEEFRPYAEAMIMIMHMERESRTAETAQGRVDLQERAEEIAASIYANNAHREPGALAKRKETIERLKKFHVSMLKGDIIALLLDGDTMGPAWQALIRPINEATWARAERLKRERDALKKLFSVYSRREMVDMKGQRFSVSGIFDPITKEQALGVLLNSGNASNLQRLMTGQNLNRNQVQAIIDTLDERDVRFAQNVWDYFETFRKESFDLEESLTGVRPEAIAAQPVQTCFGLLRGGYYPVAYDRELSAKPVDTDRLGTQTGGMFPTVDHGAMKQRTATGLRTPLALSLDVIPRHVAQTAHILAFRRPVAEVAKILRRKEVNGAIQETAGVATAKALDDWLRYVAGERPARNGWDKAASWARKNAALYIMGFKLSTMLAQVTGLLATVSEIGLRWTLRGGGGFLWSGQSPGRIPHGHGTVAHDAQPDHEHRPRNFRGVVQAHGYGGVQSDA